MFIKPAPSANPAFCIAPSRFCCSPINRPLHSPHQPLRTCTTSSYPRGSRVVLLVNRTSRSLPSPTLALYQKLALVHSELPFSRVSCLFLCKTFYSFARPLKAAAAVSNPASTSMASASQFYSFKPLDKKGQPFDFSTLKGKVVLIVNTASKCGFTPQFDGLEMLYKQLKKEYGDAFEMIGFPCNQFGGQDPGSNDDIQTFCRINYGVTFPVLGKVEVNGDGADPVWQWLKKEKPGLLGLQRVKWNFEKFLVSKDGKVVGRWASTTKPEALKAPIEAELKKPDPKE
ncbi:uncharacterized protein PV09_08136 [Verruconis gallopava]|uniref:Glutathione peroxidase n=1 Tax=Verruconis gallopava TaxID=253628 RepID=A0A0D2A1P8_9PEZI|nr:uncharacterized protein PV09_08136 [Verruconis gallopava]KIW00245.1 hypothetical protein PV09_08136 [Verruconis gallopava]